MRQVLGPALPAIDLLHANLEECCHLVGAAAPLGEAEATDAELRALVAPLLAGGVGIVALTLGASGAFVAVSADEARLRRGGAALGRAAEHWCGAEARAPALPLAGELNANGAGDAFTAGMLAALLSSEEAALTLEQAALLGSESARQRIDSARRDTPRSARALVEGMV